MPEPAGDGGAARKPGATTEDAYVGDFFVWITRVRDDHSLPTLALAVAFTIAQHFDRKTRECWPGLLRIAELVGRDEKNVRTAIKALIKGGHLVIAKHRGGGGSTHYQMPVVNRAERAKSPGPLDGETNAERAKSPGPQGSRQGAERAKSPGPSNPKGASNKAERAKSPGRSGQNRPPNQPQEPVSTESAAPQPPRGGGEGEIGNQDRPEPFLGPGEVASADPADGVWDRVEFDAQPAVEAERATRMRRERDWRIALQTEPVVNDPNPVALHDLLAEGVVSEADVMAGIANALAKADFRPRYWRSLVGWARKASSDRLASTPRTGTTPAPGSPPAADLWELEGGAKRTIPDLEREVAAWDDGFAWDAHLGFPPDHRFTTLPRHLWRSARGKPRLDGEQVTREQISGTL